MAWIPRSGKSPGGGPGNPLQYSCLENPMDRGTWWATVHGVTKSLTRLKQLSEHTHTHTHTHTQGKRGSQSRKYKEHHYLTLIKFRERFSSFRS